MGFLGSIGKVFKKAVPAVATGGLSLIAPKSVQKTLGAVLAPTSLSDIRTAASYALPAASVASGGALPMGFNVGQFLGGVSSVLGQNANPYISGVANIAGSFGTALSAPVYGPVSPYPQPQAIPVAAQLPVRRAPSLTREIFDIGVKILQKVGLPVPADAGRFAAILKRAMSALSAIARKSPTGTILTVLASLGLTAMEAAQVATWYQQKKRRRRMNPANSKALRRAARRIQGFHRLCVHTDVLRSRGRRHSAGRYGSCGTCGKRGCRGC